MKTKSEKLYTIDDSKPKRLSDHLKLIHIPFWIRQAMREMEVNDESQFHGDFEALIKRVK